MAPSCKAVIRRSASGSGPLTLLPAKCRAWADTIQNPLRHPAQTARGHGAAGPGPYRWSAEKGMEVNETWIGVRTRGDGASITKRWRPPLSRFATGSLARRKTSGRMAAMPVECDWPSPLTAAPTRCRECRHARLADRHRRLERLCTACAREIYSVFLVEEEGTASTFRALKEVFGEHGLPRSLHRPRRAHCFHTRKAGGEIDRGRSLAEAQLDR